MEGKIDNLLKKLTNLLTKSLNWYCSFFGFWGTIFLLSTIAFFGYYLSEDTYMCCMYQSGEKVFCMELERNESCPPSWYPEVGHRIYEIGNVSIFVTTSMTRTTT